MNETLTYFITWTTYGTWLPGDSRGWRKTNEGNQPPQPLLEAWCRNRMSESAVFLNEAQRRKVEAVCREHVGIRGWILHAVNARANHVHIAVTADKAPESVRDQFKANATRVLSQGPGALMSDKMWKRGGDCEVVDGERG
jgi:hypothetical protein